MLIGARFDPTLAYHRYDVVCDFASEGTIGPTDQFKFYIDTVLKATVARTGLETHTATQAPGFGDSNSPWNAAEVHWSRFEFTDNLVVPEPVTLALLGAGGMLAMLGRRRRA